MRESGRLRRQSLNEVLDAIKRGVHVGILEKTSIPDIYRLRKLFCSETRKHPQVSKSSLVSSLLEFSPI